MHCITEFHVRDVFSSDPGKVLCVLSSQVNQLSTKFLKENL